MPPSVALGSMLGTQTPAVIGSMPAPQIPAADCFAKLSQLMEWKLSGLLSEAEFVAAKRRLGLSYARGHTGPLGAMLSSPQPSGGDWCELSFIAETDSRSSCASVRIARSGCT